MVRLLHGRKMYQVPAGSYALTGTAATLTASAGWPDETNTGSRWSGTYTDENNLTINADNIGDYPGGIVEGIRFSGRLTIHTDNVTVRDCIWENVTEPFHCLFIQDGGDGQPEGTIIEYCTWDAEGAPINAILGNPRHVRYCNIAGVQNAFNMWTENNPQDIKHNYVHDLTFTDVDPHYDGLEVNGGTTQTVTFEHNHIDMSEHSQTSTVNLNNYFGPVSNITIHNNLLKGGGYTVLVDGRFDDPGDAFPITNITITNNVMVQGLFGYWQFEDCSPTVSGNTRLSDGANIDP